MATAVAAEAAAVVLHCDDAVCVEELDVLENRYNATV